MRSPFPALASQIFGSPKELNVSRACPPPSEDSEYENVLAFLQELGRGRTNSELDEYNRRAELDVVLKELINQRKSSVPNRSPSSPIPKPALEEQVEHRLWSSPERSRSRRERERRLSTNSNSSFPLMDIDEGPLEPIMSDNSDEVVEKRKVSDY